MFQDSILERSGRAQRTQQLSRLTSEKQDKRKKRTNKENNSRNIYTGKQVIQSFTVRFTFKFISEDLQI